MCELSENKTVLCREQCRVIFSLCAHFTPLVLLRAMTDFSWYALIHTSVLQMRAHTEPTITRLAQFDVL